MVDDRANAPTEPDDPVAEDLLAFCRESYPDSPEALRCAEALICDLARVAAPGRELFLARRCVAVAVELGEARLGLVCSELR